MTLFNLLFNNKPDKDIIKYLKENNNFDEYTFIRLCEFGRFNIVKFIKKFKYKDLNFISIDNLIDILNCNDINIIRWLFNNGLSKNKITNILQRFL